jgi:hypothetical protein
MKRAPLMMAAATLTLVSSLALAADQPGSFPGVVIDAKIIGGDQYEPLYTRIGEWEKLTGAKVNILTKKNGFDIDKSSSRHCRQQRQLVRPGTGHLVRSNIRAAHRSIEVGVEEGLVTTCLDHRVATIDGSLRTAAGSVRRLGALLSQEQLHG